MKTMWTFSVTKGWFRSENSLADLTTPEELKRAGFKQMSTHPQLPQLDKTIKQVIFFQRVKKTRVDYLARYIVGVTEFWFYIPNTPAFLEVFSRHHTLMHYLMMTKSPMDEFDEYEE